MMDLVEQHMTSPAITVGPGVAVRSAARTMLQHKIRRLPVVDGSGKALGCADCVLPLAYAFECGAAAPAVVGPWVVLMLHQAASAPPAASPHFPLLQRNVCQM
jgi:CBS domain-containing protein